MEIPNEIRDYLIKNKSAILDFLETNENKSKIKEHKKRKMEDENHLCKAVNLSNNNSEGNENELSRIRCCDNFQSFDEKPTNSSSDKRFNGTARKLKGPTNGPTSVVKPSRCVGIFGMSQYTDEKDLQQIFSEFGKIEKINIIRDRYNQRSRGFGFVYLRTIEEAKHAIRALSDAVIDGHKIRIDFSATNYSKI